MCLYRSGADIYSNAEQSLKQFMQPLGTEVLEACQDHLANFGPSRGLILPPQEEIVRQLLSDAQSRAEDATRAAGDVHSWRGRVAFAWASAAAYLLQAASAILIESYYDSYPIEKLDRAMAVFRDGVIEARTYQFRVSRKFATWLQSLVKASD